MLVAAVLLLLAGCSMGSEPTAAPVLPAGQTTVPPTQTAPALVPSSMPSLQPSIAPTLLPTPALNPMAILAMRQGSYPGSPIQVVETLDPGPNYHQYYAYYESQGLKIYGLLTVPFGKKPETGWPAIVFNHGYIPPDQYKTTQRYIAYVGNLASHGYIVFKIDYRGHDQSEGQPTGAYGDPGYTIDVLNAVASLKQFPEADPNRIGMWGHSMGGFLTLRAMVISPDIKAGVIWAGVVGSYPDMLCCWHLPHPSNQPTPTPDPNFRSGWRNTWQQEYGTPQENPEFWASISANSYLADLSGPLQLHHSLDDSEVPFKFSSDLYQQLLSAGRTAEFYEYPGDDHNLAQSFTLAMTRTLEFFDKYLKGNP